MPANSCRRPSSGSDARARLIAKEPVAGRDVQAAVVLAHTDMRARPVRRVAGLEIMPRFHRTPDTVDSHLNAIRRCALVLILELAAILVVTTASVLLVHPVLIIGVKALMMLLCLRAHRN